MTDLPTLALAARLALAGAASAFHHGADALYTYDDQATGGRSAHVDDVYLHDFVSSSGAQNPPFTTSAAEGNTLHALDPHIVVVEMARDIIELKDQPSSPSPDSPREPAAPTQSQPPTSGARASPDNQAPTLGLGLSGLWPQPRSPCSPPAAEPEQATHWGARAPTSSP